MPPIVTFQKVVKIYPGNIRAVDEVSFALEEGEFFCLIGPSGCGKTTLLKMVNRLVEPSSGSVWVEGKNIMEWDPIRLRRHIGYVIQQIGLFPHLTVEENITYVLSIMGVTASIRKNRARELLHIIGLEESYLYRFPRELSGGERQRVGVARALASDPKIILMDEPFGALDQINREQLQNELLRWHGLLKKTTLFVTHDLFEAMKLATRIGVMRKGQLLQVGTAGELLFNPQDPFVRDFLGKRGFFHALQMLTAKEVMETTLPIVEEGNSHLPPSIPLDPYNLGWNFVFLVDQNRRLLGAKTVHGESIPCPTIAPASSLEEVLYAMFASAQSWVAIVNEDGKFQGIVDFRLICSRLRNFCTRRDHFDNHEETLRRTLE